MSHYHHDSPLAPYPITVSARGVTLTLLSSPGMFSKDALDNGTALLIDAAELKPGMRVLDLACGNGVVGLIAKTIEPTLDVWLTDVTTKSITLTLENAKRLGLQVVVKQGDCYSGVTSERFDLILVNPPRAAGKAVIARMIEDAEEHLVVGGLLLLVAMTNKGGASYEKMMKETFGNVTKAARGSGFSVYQSIMSE